MEPQPLMPEFRCLSRHSAASKNVAETANRSRTRQAPIKPPHDDEISVKDPTDAVAPISRSAVELEYLSMVIAEPVIRREPVGRMQTAMAAVSHRK